MTALAQIYKANCYYVTGSDVTEKFFTDNVLRANHIPVFSPFSPHNIGKPTVVITSAAYPKTHLELKEARNKKIKTLYYQQALGKLTKSYRHTICVAGTHGKTTTTAMAGILFDMAKKDPTVLVGSAVKEFGGNARTSEKKNYFLMEACEYREHFLNYHPKTIVLTNVEYDHPDFYKNVAQVNESFKKFIQKLPKDGTLIYCADDAGAVMVASKTRKKKISYGFSQDADIRATYYKTKNKITTFRVLKNNRKVGILKLQVPGEHNVLNALAVIALAYRFRIKLNVVRKVLREFTGTKRRFEIVGRKRGVTIMDDYAHHPTEIQTTLLSIKKYFPNSKITAVFQPHTYSRTRSLLKEFAKSFENADKVIVAPIFASAREKKGKTGSEKLALEIAKNHSSVKYIDDFSKIVSNLNRSAKKGEVIVTMGAGDVYKIGSQVLEKLSSRS